MAGDRPDQAGMERTRDLMDRATRDCPIAGYETLLPTLDLLARLGQEFDAS